MKDFMSVSPLRVLEKSSRKQLGKGNLGVFIARAGVGKTACLIHIALDNIFRRNRLVHVSLEEGPEKVATYYRVMYSDLVKALNFPEDDEAYRILMEHNRMILAFLNQSFDESRLRANLENLSENLDFHPDAVIIDGLDFESAPRGLFEGLKALAGDFSVELWLSARSHRHILLENERGIPYPCHESDDLLSVIIQLQPEPDGVFLRLLKDHDHATLPDAVVRLDPNTFLAMGRP